jgi:hypothetical protein
MFEQPDPPPEKRDRLNRRKANLLVITVVMAAASMCARAM